MYTLLKIKSGQDITWISFLISQKISYKHRTDLENNTNACITLEVITAKNKRVFFIGKYRQWKDKAPGFSQNSNSS